jgi:peptidoglycan/LPS O-acetylase OafA/YrhL
MKYIPYREDIDALRGLAVFLVVVYHAFPKLLPGGFIGVDVFFVISGYLITSIIFFSLNNNNFSLIDFYARRIRRLFPALATVLLVVLVFGWLVLFPEEYEQLGKHVTKSVVFLLNFQLINEINYFDVENHYKPLLNLWTLSIEEQYYLFWPLLILFFFKIKKSPNYTLVLAFIISFSINVYFVKDYSQKVYYHTLARFWQLAAGSLLAVWLMNYKVLQNSNNSKTKILIGGGGVILIVIGALWINGQMIYPGLLAIVPVLGAAMVIISNIKLKQYFGFVKLGLISYPLYLWHWVIISFLYIYLGRKPETFVLVLAVFLSLTFAYFTYKYIEQFRYQKSLTPYLISLLIIIGLFGFYVKEKKGLPDRSNMQSYGEAIQHFKRTPAKDETCLNYSRGLLGDQQTFDYCRADPDIKNKAKKLIAIIGDSHAHTLFPGISKVALSKGYETILLANSSCPTLKDFEWGNNNLEINICKKKIEEILTIIQKEPRIEKVIMTTRGPVYIHGEVDGILTEENIKKNLSLIKNQKITYENYFDGFKNTMEVLENIPHIKKVFYKLENPELDFLPKETISRPYDFFGTSVNRDTISRKLYLQRMSLYRENIFKLSFSKLLVLDPIKALCDDDICFSKVEGKFLYADDDHFSEFGSIYIANYFQNIIFNDF